MADEQLVVIGAGGFGRETLDVIEALIADGEPLKLLGVVDSGPRDADLERLAARGIRYLGTEADWLSTCSGAERFVVAIGSPRVRQEVASRLIAAGLRAVTVIHPRAVVGSEVKVGDGVVVASGAQVSTNVKLGDHVHLNPGSIIGHDSVLAQYVSVNPGAIVSGNVVVHGGALLGAGSTILQGLTIGKAAIVGAAACVTRDVDAADTVVGVPARPKTSNGSSS